MILNRFASKLARTVVLRYECFQRFFCVVEEMKTVPNAKPMTAEKRLKMFGSDHRVVAGMKS
jgi:hypothetical protein